MKRNMLVILGLLVLGLGLLAFVLFGSNDSKKTSSESADDNTSSSMVLSEQHRATASTHLKTAVKKQSVDATNKAEVTVDIGDFYYDATVLKISKGTKVTWRNGGMIGHDVKTSNNSPLQLPDSELLERNETYTHEFTEAGLYLYYCSPHPVQMRGVIEVVES